MQDARSVTVPTLVTQVHDDFRTKPSNVQEIFDTIAAEDKKLFWIEGTDERFQGYNYWNDHPSSCSSGSTPTSKAKRRERRADRASQLRRKAELRRSLTKLREITDPWR